MHKFRWILTILIITFTVVPFAHADEIADLKAMVQDLKNDYESRINALEARIAELESEKNQQMAVMKEEIKEEIAAESISAEYIGRYDGPFGQGGLVVEAPSGNSRVSLGGYMDHEFENFENTDSTFDQHHWIINVGAELGERLRFFSEYEIEHGGPDAGGEAKVEQAWVDYLINDMVNFRAGAVIVPFGRTNIYHDSDVRDLTSRPLIARDIIPTTWTESGVGLHGELDPTFGEYEDLLINYETYVVNGLDDGFSDTGLGGARGSLESDNNNSKAVVGRLVASPFLGHEIGLSGYWGKYNNLDDDISGIAVDWLSTWGPLEFTGEWAHFGVDEPAFTPGSVTDAPKTFDGYRIQANYHFWPKFLNGTFLARSFEDPTLTLVSRYGWAKIDDDSDATSGDNEESRFTLGLNYRPLESWVFKLEHQWNATDNESLERGDNNGFLWSVAMGF